jgi:uncharacterized protein with PQ loop repeat
MAEFLENYIASIATFFLVVAYLPQVIHTYRTKKVDGISLPFWALINVALTCLLINAAFIYVKYGTWGYLVTEILNEGLAFVMLVMVLKYRKKGAE